MVEGIIQRRNLRRAIKKKNKIMPFAATRVDLEIIILSKISQRQISYDSTYMWGFLYGSAGKESACNSGDLCLIPGLGRSPGEGKGCPLMYSGLNNSMDCVVHGVAKSQTGQSDFHFRMWKPKKKITKELIYNRNKLTGIENKLMVIRGGRRDKLEILN